MTDFDASWGPTVPGETFKTPNQGSGVGLVYRSVAIANASGGPVYGGFGLGSSPSASSADFIVPEHGTVVRGLPNVNGLSLLWGGPSAGGDLVTITLSTDGLAGSPSVGVPPPRVATSDVIAPGIIFPYAAGGVPPGGFLLCDGAAVDRDQYSSLFAAIGVTYGPGNGSTTFNVPNLSERFPFGAGGGTPLGQTGGERDHVLTDAEMPPHAHGTPNGQSFATAPGGYATAAAGAAAATVASLVATTANAGFGVAHNNMPPWTSINYVIKT